MRKMLILGAATAVASSGFGVANAGDAYKLTPPQTNFTATGQGTVSGMPGSYTCTVTMTGRTAKSVGVISTISFSGAPGCENVTAMHLPWHIRPISTDTAQISHANLAYAGLGRCGPNQIKAVISGGEISIDDHLPSKEGVCEISASLTVTPSLSITGP